MGSSPKRPGRGGGLTSIAEFDDGGSAPPTSPLPRCWSLGA